MPSCQRFTRHAGTRTRLNRVSIRLVDDATRFRLFGQIQAHHGKGFLQTLAQGARAAGVLEAERHFRKIAGFRALPKLVAALRAHDATIDRARQVENGKRAA